MLMLKKIRRTLAVLFTGLLTLMLLDFTGTLHTWLGWMAKVQLLPAVLALNVGVIVLLVVLTLGALHDCLGLQFRHRPIPKSNLHPQQKQFFGQ